MTTHHFLLDFRTYVRRLNVCTRPGSWHWSPSWPTPTRPPVTAPDSPRWCDVAAAAGLVGRLRRAPRPACFPSRRSKDPVSRPRALLTGGGRRSTRDAEAAARRAAVCADLPEVHDALAAGQVSAGHVDAVARLAGELDDAARAELKDLQSAVVGSASVMPVEAFEREIRNLGRILSRDDGISQLHRLQAAALCAALGGSGDAGCVTPTSKSTPRPTPASPPRLDAAVAAASSQLQGDDVEFDHLKADALVGLITGARTTGRRVPDLTVLTDARTLRHGPPRRHGVRNRRRPTRSRSRRSAGTAATPPSPRSPSTTTGSRSTWAGPGGSPPPSSAARCAAMYRTCGFPGCQVRFEDCRIHHVTWWEHLGATNLDNLLPMCERHHHHVHEGGWTLTLKPDRTITLRRPDGTLHHEGNHHQPDADPRPPP